MIHTRSQTITFRSAFTLPGLERSYPAGSYRVTIDDEQLDLNFAASRRIATTIMLASGATTLAWLVAPADLDEALAQDATKAHG